MRRRKPVAFRLCSDLPSHRLALIRYPGSRTSGDTRVVGDMGAVEHADFGIERRGLASPRVSSWLAPHP
jgi:hypothetical protein